MTLNPLHTPTQKIIRDLYWTLMSPSLFDSKSTARFEFKFTIPSEYFTKIILDSKLVAPLLNQPNRKKLGIFFEDLVEFCIQTIEKPNLFYRNLPIRSGGKTLGELDFIFGNLNDAIHLETAVKFYLGTSEGYLGPNPIDSYEKKINRLLNHQMKLSGNPATGEELKKLNLKFSHSSAFFKGRLFHHPGHHPSLPLHGSVDALCGWWCSIGELDSFLNSSEYLILDRLEWITPFFFKSELPRPPLDRPCVVKKLKEHFDASIQPVLLFEFETKGESVVEKSRGFVVSPYWPRQSIGTKL